MTDQPGPEVLSKDQSPEPKGAETQRKQDPEEPKLRDLIAKEQARRFHDG